VMFATEIAIIGYLAYLLWSFAGVSLRRLALVTATGTLGLALIGFWPQLLERLG